MHSIHVFLLIVSLGGQPEHIRAVCETYKQCSDEGAEIGAAYLHMFHKMPRDVSLRIIPATIIPAVEDES
jgi:hypothetical protein